jgi:predicted nucleotidyltransferase
MRRKGGADGFSKKERYRTGGGMNMSVRVEIPKEQIEAFCRRNHIRRLAFFGSVLRDDFTPESDVDVLVEFEPGVRVGLRFFGMEQELSEILGRRVDLNTPGFLSKYFRDEVIAEAEVLYGAA